MKLYQAYLAERDGASVHYTDDGFITYACAPGGECYFSEIYVVPHKRNTRATLGFWLHVLSEAKKHNCTHITGSVDTNTNNWQLSENIMLKLGFRCERQFGSMKFYRKPL